MKIGFIVPMGEDPDVGRPPSYDEMRALALRVEQAGFDSVWVYDHLLYRFPDRPPMGVWECWSTLAALAEATERVELGTLIVAALWRNPALLAKMAITVDEISGGRLILGLGTGYHEPEFAAFSYPYDHLASRFEEAIRIIAPLLRDGNVDFEGRFYSAPNCEMKPGPTRLGGPPILVACRGERMLKITAEHADLWNTAWFGDVSASANRRAEMTAACEAVGRDPATLGITVGVNVAWPFPGIDLPDPIDPAKTLTGSPAEVAAALRAYEEAGVAHIICGGLAGSRFDYAAHVIDRLGEALAVYRATSSVGGTAG